MSPTRRDFLRLAARAGALAGATSALGGAAACSTADADSEPTAGGGVQTPPAPMDILVLGGTGFIGPHLVRYAVDRGHNVTLFNRGRTNADLFPDLETLIGDRDNDLTALEGRSWDVALDLPATLPRWVRQSAQLLSGSVGQYAFVSTISVYADNSEPWADESAALNTTDDPTNEDRGGENYGWQKALAEQEARNAFPDNALIVRPGLIVGPGDPTDRWTYWPERIDRGGEVLAPGDGTDSTQFIDARDLTEWMVRMVERGQGGTYNATGPAEELSMATMIAELQTVASNPSEITWVDEQWLADQGVRRWSDMPMWFGTAPETAGFLKRSIAAALAQGLTFRSVAEIARDTLAWHATRPAEAQEALAWGISGSARPNCWRVGTLDPHDERVGMRVQSNGWILLMATAGMALGAQIAQAQDSDSDRSAGDEWFAKDKAKHFAASAVLAAGGYALGATLYDSRAGRVAVGTVISLSAGIAKEAYDARGNGVASWRDMAWNGIGLVVGLGIAALIDGETPSTVGGLDTSNDARFGPRLAGQTNGQNPTPAIARDPEVGVPQDIVGQWVREFSHDDRVRPDLASLLP